MYTKYNFTYMCMSMYTYQKEDCCMNTIEDMHNEMYIYDHCKEFEYNHDILKFS